MSENKINPEDYLRKIKDNLIQEIKENHPKADPEVYYNKLIIIIKRLREHRLHGNITDNILLEYQEELQFPLRALLTESLRKSLQHDKSFNKAYIRLLQIHNRENSYFPIPIEIIPENELYSLIENEDLIVTSEEEQERDINIKNTNGDNKSRLTSNTAIHFPDDKIEKIHNHLKKYFPKQERELYDLLQGKHLELKLRFEGNANQLSELARRMSYNGILEYHFTELRDWIVTNFQYRGQQNREEGFKDFNPQSTYNVLLEKQGKRPPKEKRIINEDWLPYKSYEQVKSESKHNKL